LILLKNLSLFVNNLMIWNCQNSIL
jgi:hypothetical protein